MIKLKRRKEKTQEKPKSGPKGGRPRIYTKQLGSYICKQLMLGKSLTSILRKDGMPSMPTVYAWLNKNSTTYQEEFLEAYLTAREVQAEVLADEIKDISDDGLNDTYEVFNERTNCMETRIDHDHIKRSQLRVESRKWLAAHLLPRKFSDRMQITGAEGKDFIPSAPTKVVFNFVHRGEDDK